jgi:hypothetical protein
MQTESFGESLTIIKLININSYGFRNRRYTHLEGASALNRLDAAGHLSGTTTACGNSNRGTVWKLTP